MLLLLLSWFVQLLALVLGIVLGTGAVGGAVFIVVLEAHMGLRIAEHLRRLHEQAKQARAMGKPVGTRAS